MMDKLNRMAQAYRGDGSHLETLTQVRRLTNAALKQISRKFEELDAHTGEVMSLALSPDGKRLAAGGMDKAVSVWKLVD